uniref:Zinc finger protein CONSTANS-LIKE 6 n=1 Tax=Lagerstroemia indica TaxID=141186 RepID=A0A068L789_9MYRT|nr:zinc finger protein CONSTANS-LIKE 6 [Lagerstroemia indica]
MNTSEHHQSKASNVLGGKTARACDNCLVKRARWFCPGDDAFLCQSCDHSVHSANLLASRHKRVRLETSSSSFKKEILIDNSTTSPPSWHHGFTRKARTPRPWRRTPQLDRHQLPLVPEINSEDPFMEESDEQLFCRVPVFDPFCTDFVKGEEMFLDDQEMILEHDLNLDELLSTCEDDLAEFAADVECLLGGGEDLGLMDCRERVKVEEREDEEVKGVVQCNLDVEGKWGCGEEVKRVSGGNETTSLSKNDVEKESQVKKRMLLRLNYEAVIASWATQGSPWTDGIRPQFNLDEFMVACLGGSCYELGGLSRAKIGGREARVSRYREKRRTRLFSKKIRYEVRKLNAEKRPRMKGRFVKRSTTFSGSSLPYQLINK